MAGGHSCGDACGSALPTQTVWLEAVSDNTKQTSTEHVTVNSDLD